ncbi:heme/hemin ABC transporter substrate-binding protein [Demequina globuliformis]|uniref:heme/hemin ABC transporter substrate-binding protein n=1 Tax=Demequina globuliformis TaxID=676202 RepID=UPI000AF89ABF|nr:ABC transporter substrate-binding protein [Demequina globuliformis]
MPVRSARGAIAAVTAAAALALAACAVPLTPTDSRAGAVETGSGEASAAEPAASPAGSTAEGTPASEAPHGPVPWTDLKVLSDPHTYVGPSTATIADPSVVALAPAPEPNLPVTVVSRERDGDRDVTVTDTSRVVAMDISGSIAATAWALGQGDRLVGRDASAEFPGTEDLPVVTGSSHTVSPEAVLALEPTVVITDGSIGPSDAIAQIRDAGVPVVYVDNGATFAGAEELARQVAQALGVAPAGEEVAGLIADQVAATSAQIKQVAPSEGMRVMMLYLRGASGIYYMFGSESGADQIISALGGVDAASETGLEGMKPLTDEAMLAADPEAIIVMTRGLESVGGVEGLLEAKPAIALTAAGQNARIIDMADNQLLAFGPRSAAIVDALARALYAPES